MSDVKYYQFAANEEEFNNDNAVAFYEFRPGLLPTSAESPADEHPGFDWDNGALYKYMRPAAGDVWGLATLVTYCSLDNARETMDHMFDGEYYEYAVE